MINRLGGLLKWLVLLPVFIIVVLFAVANDHVVRVALNPFDITKPPQTAPTAKIANPSW